MLIENWQDAVIACGQVAFIVALVPALLGDAKPPRSTCLLTGTILAVFAFTFATLSLWFGSLMAAACSACWFVLLFQRRRQ